MVEHEIARWRCRYRLSKYREDIGPYRGREDEFHRLFRPCEVREGEGNCLLNTGIDEMWDLIAGDSANHFDNSGARIGVGDSSTAADASQTDLQAASNKTYKAMESGYPTTSSQKATFGKCLNRKVESLGTKSGGTWTLEVSITLS
jgi:hypothetical protein